jgi:hypothetical protein
MTTSNPFAENPHDSNPYSSSNAAASGPTTSALLLPAIFLLVSSAFSALYMVAMVFAPEGPFSGSGASSMRPMLGVSYSLVLVTSLISVAGSVAMLRRKPKWLAWTGSILALLPLFGPCLGLKLPFGIWCLVILRRPEVNAGFVS